MTLCFSPDLMSQDHTIGRVVDESLYPIPYAVVQLSFLDSSVVFFEGIVTDSLGYFTFKDLPMGDYEVDVQSLGFETLTDTIFLPNPKEKLLLTLKKTIANLETIEVVGRRSVLEGGLGKKVLRIGADLSQSGSAIVDALERIPAVQITESGGIQIRGSSQVVLYINGKESKRSLESLKFLSVDVLESIEVITQPSAKYDAEGVGGIINLVYKKNLQTPFKLEGVLNATHPTRFSGGVNAGFHRSKTTFYSNLIMNRSNSIDFEESDRVSRVEQIGDFRQQSRLDGKHKINMLDMGFTFEPDTVISVEMALNYNRWDSRFKGLQESQLGFESTDPDTQLKLPHESGELEDEGMVSLSLQKVKNPRKRWGFSIVLEGENEENVASYDSIKQGNEFFQQYLSTSNETEQQRLYQFKFDQTVPFLKKAQWEWGGKLDIIQFKIFQQLQLQSDLIEIPDNNFKIDLTKGAGYVQFQQDGLQWDYLIGVRVEHFSSLGLLVGSPSFRQTFWRLFPSLQLQYTFRESGTSIGASWTQRMNRPGFFDLNPYVSYEDPFNLETGNPRLKPEIANLFEFNAHHHLEQGGLDLTLFHRKTNDVIQSLIIAQEENQSIQSYENFAQSIQFGVESQFDYSWSNQFNTTLTFALGAATFKDPQFFLNDSRRTYYRVRFTPTWDLSKYWQFRGGLTYNSPRIGPQETELAYYYMDASIIKKFKSKRGSIALNFSDFLNTRVFRVAIENDTFVINRRYKWQTRRITLALRYLILGN